MPIVRDHPRLAVFFFVYYASLLVYGALAGEAQTAFYALFLAIAATIVTLVYARVRLSTVALWGLALWGLGHMVGGLVQIGGDVIYEHSLGHGQLRFDKVVHFFGFGFATLAAFEILCLTIATEAPRRSTAIAAFFIGLGIGAINETVEFLITLLPGDSNVGGFSNTGWDLVANTLGAATFALIATRRAAPLTRAHGGPDVPVR
ncbi:MAG TPA: DUF2238 domain-containing protein [Actinomycetota bacterium]|nr:DUF2238 domain-containing protein [Actinomycetota bacterium]